GESGLACKRTAGVTQVLQYAVQGASLTERVSGKYRSLRTRTQKTAKGSMRQDELALLGGPSGDGFFADDPAIFELDDSVAVGGVSLGVCNLDDGGAAFVKPLEELHDLFALSGVQVAGGLVGKNELGRHDDGARDTYKLLLAAGELIGEEILL